MLVLLTDSWWVLMLRGVLAILVGVLAWTFPGLALAALIVMFGAYSLVNGLLALFATFSTQAPGKGWLFFEGILGIVVAAVAFFLPGMTAIALLALVAAWSLMTGTLLIASAFVLRK